MNTGRRYLFTIDGENADAVLPLVCDIVADAAGELVIGNPVILPEQTPLTAPEPRMEVDRIAAEFKLRAMERCGDTIQVDQVVKVGNSRESVVQQLMFGAIPERVGERAENTVIMAKRQSGLASRLKRWFRTRQG